MSGRQWTVMIYMAGDNNLDADGLADLYEIKRVGSREGVVDIVAQFDRFGTSRPTRRYHLRNWSVHNLQQDIKGPDLPETNTGDPTVLTKFIEWGIQEFPAEKYIVIIWAHGMGTFDEDVFRSGTRAGSRSMMRPVKQHGIFRPTPSPVAVPNPSPASSTAAAPPPSVELIAPDDTDQDFLDNVELKKALKDVGQPIDILGMDACLMSMAEVCYQVRGSVDITVGSEDEEALDGWPYGGFLAKLVDDPTMPPAQLAATIVNEFGLKYSEIADATATLSACNLRPTLVQGLAERINALAAAMIDEFESVADAISLARFQCWANELIASVDLADFCKVLRQKTSNATVRTACTNVIDFITSHEFVFSRTSVGFHEKFTNGLGIYFPTRWVSKKYGNLDMIDPSVTRWLEFIETFVDGQERDDT